MAVLWLLVLLPPLVVVPAARDAFRLPKLMVSELLALASLVPLSFRLRSVGRVRPWELPAVRAVVPLLALATVSLATTEHPLHVRRGLVDLSIGAACLVGWSAGLDAPRLGRLLRGLAVPAGLLAVLAALQFHGAYRPFAFTGGEERWRTGVTSLAGNAGDLAAYLVLPCLIAQRRLVTAQGWGRGLWALVAAVSVYGIAVSQTIAAWVALLAGSAVLWIVSLPRRRLAASLAAIVILGGAMLLGVSELRERVAAKASQVAAGDWNDVLTGRLDAWRAALWMFGRHPLAGVGHGAYAAEFAPAKLALSEQGVEFWDRHLLPAFGNAHNEPLELAAELGLPGLLAALWAAWVISRRAAHKRGGDRALAWAGLAGLSVLSLAHFPFHLALVAYPALLFVAWILRSGDDG